MLKLYIEVNGHKICLKMKKEMDFFYNVIKKTFSGNITRKTNSIEGILEISHGSGSRGVLKGKRKAYFCEKDLFGNRVFIWKHSRKDIINAIYFVRLDQPRIDNASSTCNIAARVIRDFSSECSVFLKSLIFHASGLEKNKNAFL